MFQRTHKVVGRAALQRGNIGHQNVGGVNANIGHDERHGEQQCSHDPHEQHDDTSQHAQHYQEEPADAVAAGAAFHGAEGIREREVDAEQRKHEQERQRDNEHRVAKRVDGVNCNIRFT